MWKKLFSLVLVVLLCHAVDAVFVRNVRAGQGGTVEDKVKTSVAKRGTGPKAKVTVKLKDKTKLKGYISETSNDSFTLADSKTGQTRTLNYQDVAEVKKQGGMSLAAKIGIGFGVGVGALALLFAIGCAGDNGYVC